MIPLMIFAAASADLDALDQAVVRCDRNMANPVFASESSRRSQFLLDTYREQEAIVTSRLAIADQRRALRETPTGTAAQQKEAEKQLDLQLANLDDRQKALNDKRMLEGIRQDAMDQMRRFYLSNCPAGGDIK